MMMFEKPRQAWRRSRALFLASILLLPFGQSIAQAPSAADFTRRPEAWEVSLSPSGDYVALAVPSRDGLETQLEITNLATGDTQVLRFGLRFHVSDVVWTDDDQVVVSRAEMQPFKSRPVSMGHLYTSDIRGQNRDVLFGYVPDSGSRRGRRKDEGWSSVIRVLNSEPGMALVRFDCWNCGDDPDTVIFEVNTKTGDRREVERGNMRASYQFDLTGRARFRTTFDDDNEPSVSYRRTAEDDWSPLPKSIAGRLLYGARFASDGNTVYALVTDALEPAQAYRIDLQAGTRTRLAGFSDVGATGFMYEGRDGIPFAVTSDEYKPSIQYLDPNSPWAQLHAGLMKSFPGQMVDFTGFSRDGNKVLFSVWSDRDIGSYYVYDRATRQVQKIIDYMPWLKPENMAQTRPIEFTNRDGMTIHGFYTAMGTGPKPLVVMAHGGPFGVYDQWSFDDEVQYLATHGYAVLQVNYRGSGGRGEAFQRSGWQGWGTTIQNDITDGVRWAIQQNLADPQRICTFGASFGGYTALIQPILNPGMYKCAIGYVGVYDLPLMLRTDRNQGAPMRTQRFFDRTLGTDMETLAGISPVQRAAELQVPVMLAHGKDDQTANFNQYKAMVAALNSQNRPPELYAVPGEGHGFVNPENRAELFRRVQAFLDKYIGPNAH